MAASKFLCFVFLTLAIYSPIQASIQAKSIRASPFSIALETLQNQINYTFQRIDLLSRSMTHASYSEENNKALSILGSSLIETSVSLSSLTNDIDMSSKALNNRIEDISKVDTCALDGTKLGLQKIVRVSRKTNSSAPAVVCGAFRAIFGAIAVDNENSDAAGRVFWYVYSGGIGRASAL